MKDEYMNLSKGEKTKGRIKDVINVRPVTTAASPYFSSHFSRSPEDLLETNQNKRHSKRKKSSLNERVAYPPLTIQHQQIAKSKETPLSKSLPTLLTPTQSLLSLKPKIILKMKEDWSFGVHVRIRPIDDNSSPGIRIRCVTIDDDGTLVLSTRPNTNIEHQKSAIHHFNFGKIYGERSTQKEVFEGTGQELVNYALKGFNTCVIAHGISGSGKSYTLHGKPCGGKTKGLALRSVDALLKHRTDEDITQFTLKASFVQIYNEKFYDLIDPSASENIRFLEDSQRLDGVTQADIRSSDDVCKILRKNPNRLRDGGGRSHTVLIIRMKKDEMDVDREGITSTESCMYFVDLVGINRSVRHITHESPVVSSAETKNAKSLQLFNQMLQQHEAFDSYKESKMTRILKDCVGGDWITRLVVTVTPDPSLSHETLNCLQVVTSARSIKNIPKEQTTWQRKQSLSSLSTSRSTTPEEIPAGEIPGKLPPITSERNSSKSPDRNDIISKQLEMPLTARTSLPYLQLPSPKVHSRSPNKEEQSTKQTDGNNNNFDETNQHQLPKNAIMTTTMELTNVVERPTSSKLTSEAVVKTSQMEESDKVCCAKCDEYIAKIKKDYDRMIIFSKKDRDEKQTRLRDLEESVRGLQQEAMLAHQIKNALMDEAVMNATKEMNDEITSLTAKLKLETDLHSRTRSNVDRLKKDSALRLTESNRRWEEKLSNLTTSQKKEVSKLEKTIKDLTTRYGALSQERDKYKKAENELKNKFSNEKETLQNEIKELQKNIKELEKEVQENMKTSKKNEVVKESTTDSDSAAGCELNRADEEATLQRDEELRMLLLQDAKNREVLIQLKRDRNLLRDVMRIIYARGWFKSDAKAHVERALYRVGLDLRNSSKR